MSHNHDHPHSHSTEVDATELRSYIEHNIRHLEEHIKSFNKLQNKLGDAHSRESLQQAVEYLTKGTAELKHLLAQIV